MIGQIIPSGQFSQKDAASATHNFDRNAKSFIVKTSADSYAKVVKNVINDHITVFFFLWVTWKLEGSVKQTSSSLTQWVTLNMLFT